MQCYYLQVTSCPLFNDTMKKVVFILFILSPAILRLTVLLAHFQRYTPTKESSCGNYVSSMLILYVIEVCSKVYYSIFHFKFIF